METLDNSVVRRQRLHLLSQGKFLARKMCAAEVVWTHVRAR